MNKKVLIAMDSFKGTFSSYEMNNLVKMGLMQNNRNLDFECINIADGGEGSVDALLNAINGTLIRKEVVGPYKEKIDSYYGIGTLNCEKIAIIEVASVVGFQYKKDDNDPGMVTTYGIGELIIDAINNNVKDIYVCLGGSISNDAGSGIVNALGVKFFDKDNNEFLPTGKTLNNIKRIDNSNLYEGLKKVNIYCLCDVTNPFFGPKGAAFVFAKQKGAKVEELPLLDDNLKYYHNQCVKDLNVNVDSCNLEGTGAAGGICYSLVTILNAKILSGIKTILKLNNICEKISNCDVVITGEGKLDSQSFDGKVISEIKNEAVKNRKKLIGVFGCSEVEKDDYLDIIPIFDLDDPNTIHNDYLIKNTKEKLFNKLSKVVIK